MLEDDFTYVLRKALKGLTLSPGEAAFRAGLDEKEVLAFSRGTFSAQVARRLAPVLGLNPEAFAGHPDYLPRPIHLSEIQRLDLPFREERVNAWLIETGDTRLLFDTGTDSRSCRDSLGDRLPDAIFITHGHGDHIGGNASFSEIPIYGSAINHANSVTPGDCISIGSLTVRAVDLSGHFKPALGYFIDGLTRPVLVVGDALFAGSIGGCATPELYQLALSRLKSVLTPLPGFTVLLPGHGPATTWDEERVANPFL